MIDQKKILGHREPYNGMGEAVGLPHWCQTPQRQRANELKIKNQGRTSQETKNRDQGVRDKNQRTRDSKDIKKHQENALKKEQAGRIAHDKIRQSTHATRTPHPVKYDPMLGNTKTKRVLIHRALRSSPNSDCPALISQH